MDGFSLSPVMGSFHGAAGVRGAPTAEKTLGPTSLHRASEREDCYSDRSQHRLVGFGLLPGWQSYFTASFHVAVEQANL